MVIVGIMAQLESSVPLELDLFIDQCKCNQTALPSVLDMLEESKVQHDFSLFRISYMWYPFVGCVLTVVFSLIVSYLDSTIKYRNVLKINNRIIQQSTGIVEQKDGVDNIAYNVEKY